MIDLIIFIWILIFLIFFVAGIVTDNPIFGLVAGALLMLFGLGISVDGMQMTSGMTITTVGNVTNVSYDYTEITAPFSTWGTVFGLTLIAISIYIIFRNADEAWG